jgi:hypothetical protein
MIKSLKSLALLAMIVSLAACSRGEIARTSTKTVDIPQTPVKSQGHVGFCWSYATIGLIESIILRKTGIQMDLSEESLGFYRMAEELHALSQRVDAAEVADADLVKKKVFEDLEGWDVTFNPLYNPGLSVRNALQLVRDFGVVPESSWSYKFRDGDQETALLQHIYAGFAKLMNTHGRSKVTWEMIVDLLAEKEAFGSKPPSTFDYLTASGEKKTYDAKEFIADVAGFTVDDYTYMIPDATIGYDQIVKAIKLTLERGLAIPLSYMIYEETFNEWDASYSVQDPNREFKQDGGHVVLVTDFVNVGGRPGSVPRDEMLAEMAKPSSALDYLIVKNSWDSHLASPLLRHPGYHTMYQSYLQLLVKKPVDITIVVPRDIAFQVRYGR